MPWTNRVTQVKMANSRLSKHCRAATTHYTHLLRLNSNKTSLGNQKFHDCSGDQVKTLDKALITRERCPNSSLPKRAPLRTIYSTIAMKWCHPVDYRFNPAMQWIQTLLKGQFLGILSKQMGAHRLRLSSKTATRSLPTSHYRCGYRRTCNKETSASKFLPQSHLKNLPISGSSKIRILRVVMGAAKRAAMAGLKVANFRAIQWIVGAASERHTFLTQRLCRTCSRKIAAMWDQPKNNHKLLNSRICSNV